MQRRVNLSTRLSVTPTEDSMLDINLELWYSITTKPNPQLEQHILNVCQRVIGSYLKPRTIDIQGQLSRPLTHLIPLKTYEPQDPSLKLDLTELKLVDEIMDGLGGSDENSLQILSLRVSIPVSWIRKMIIVRSEVMYNVNYAYQVFDTYASQEEQMRDVRVYSKRLSVDLERAWVEKKAGLGTSWDAKLEQSEHLELIQCESALILALVSTSARCIELRSSLLPSYCALM